MCPNRRVKSATRTLLSMQAIGGAVGLSATVSDLTGRSWYESCSWLVAGAGGGTVSPPRSSGGLYGEGYGDDSCEQQIFYYGERWFWWVGRWGPGKLVAPAILEIIVILEFIC